MYAEKATNPISQTVFIFFIISVFRAIFSILVHRDPYKSPALILSYLVIYKHSK